MLVVGGAGALAGGRLVDRLGTRPAFLIAGTIGAAAIAVSSYQHALLAFAVSYAVGAGVMSALGFYHVTQPAAIRAAGDQPQRAVVWLTILGAFASPIFLPLTARWSARSAGATRSGCSPRSLRSRSWRPPPRTEPARRPLTRGELAMERG